MIRDYAPAGLVIRMLSVLYSEARAQFYRRFKPVARQGIHKQQCSSYFQIMPKAFGTQMTQIL
jgi:hypothetical protein